MAMVAFLQAQGEVGANFHLKHSIEYLGMSSPISVLVPPQANSLP